MEKPKEVRDCKIGKASCQPIATNHIRLCHRLWQSGRSSPPSGPLFFATVLAFLQSDWGFWADRLRYLGRKQVADINFVTYRPRAGGRLTNRC